MCSTRLTATLLALIATVVVMVSASTLPAAQPGAPPVTLDRRTLPQKAVTLAGEMAKAVVAGAAFNVIKEKCSEIAGYKEQAVKEQAAEVVKAIQDCESKKK
ncbi:hypothetical protein IWQ60_002916 [Tieghemiomyces parasiticus]|uniref:Uncharacterized protein n=1 Tax=Tieghemiomyces parasiticus TaxID=78921 RepID=A0A9W8AE91_9FUNG|nr:hypothetical protein IWQ60_002916 [Tieghemiomyces parasiticus]